MFFNIGVHDIFIKLCATSASQMLLHLQFAVPMPYFPQQSLLNDIFLVKDISNVTWYMLVRIYADLSLEAEAIDLQRQQHRIYFKTPLFPSAQQQSQSSKAMQKTHLELEMSEKHNSFFCFDRFPIISMPELRLQMAPICQTGPNVLELATIAARIIYFISEYDEAKYEGKTFYQTAVRFIENLKRQFRIFQQRLFQPFIELFAKGCDYNKKYDEQIIQFRSNWKKKTDAVIRKVFNFIFNRRVEGSFYIFGEGSFERSNCVRLLASLSQFCINYQCHQKLLNRTRQEFQRLNPAHIIHFEKTVPKFFYFALSREMGNLGRFRKQIQRQMFYELKSHSFRTGSIFQNISNFYADHSRRVNFILDEVNIYYQIFDQLKKAKCEQQYQQLRQEGVELSGFFSFISKVIAAFSLLPTNNFQTASLRSMTRDSAESSTNSISLSKFKISPTNQRPAVHID